jgi:hypothetical protein
MDSQHTTSRDAVAAAEDKSLFARGRPRPWSGAQGSSGARPEAETLPSRERPGRSRWHVRPVALARLLAALSLLAIGGVHIQLYIVQDYRVIPTIGRLFLLNFIGGTILGLYFMIPGGRRAGQVRRLVDGVAALAGWFLAVGALVALLVSEHTPLFGFMEYGYRFAIVFAIVSEAVAIVALTIVLVDNRTGARRRPGPRRNSTMTVVRPADATK